jgi:hypothetical protein
MCRTCDVCIQYTGALPAPRVAFYSRRDTDGDVSLLGEHGTIIFEGVTVNDGAAYNHVTGMFTCHVTGTYVFSWTISVANRSYLYAELVVNGVARGKTMTDAHDLPAAGDSASGLILVHLAANDVVWVRMAMSGTGSLYCYRHHSESASYCMFAGWLMYR